MTSFKKAFERYGLPLRIRTDNGAPFASRGIGGLSRLSVWWIKLGIVPERIEPGQPQQNGSHERMHRTLKAEAIQHRRTLGAQQVGFDRFRRYFNEERPHEALQQTPPILHYQVSSRELPRKVSDPVYPDSFETHLVPAPGVLPWKGGVLRLGRLLVGQAVGLEAIDDCRWNAWFGPVLLGEVNKDGSEITLRKNNHNPRKSSA